MLDSQRVKKNNLNFVYMTFLLNTFQTMIAKIEAQCRKHDNHELKKQVKKSSEAF